MKFVAFWNREKKYYKKYLWKILLVELLLIQIFVKIYIRFYKCIYNCHILNLTSGQVCRQSSMSSAYSTSDWSGGQATFDTLHQSQCAASLRRYFTLVQMGSFWGHLYYTNWRCYCWQQISCCQWNKMSKQWSKKGTIQMPTYFHCGQQFYKGEKSSRFMKFKSDI